MSDSMDASDYVAQAAGKKPKSQRDLEWFLEHIGFGTWEQEHKFLPDRRFRFDYALPDLRVAIEYDGMNGGAHGSVNGMMRDSEKSNLAQIHGWIIIRVNAATLRTGLAYQWIEDAVALRRTE